MENIQKNTAIGKNLKFKVLLDECEIANLPKKERLLYEENLKTYRDWYAYEQTFLQQGEKIGIEKGEKIGEEITLKVIQLIYQAKTDEEISKITGKSIENIKKIRNSLKF